MTEGCVKNQVGVGKGIRVHVCVARSRKKGQGAAGGTPLQPGEAGGGSWQPDSSLSWGAPQGDCAGGEAGRIPASPFRNTQCLHFFLSAAWVPPRTWGCHILGGEQGLCVPAPPLAAWFSASVPAEEEHRAGTPPGLGPAGWTWGLRGSSPQIVTSAKFLLLWQMDLSMGGGRGGRDGEIGAGGVCVKWERK